MHSSASVQNVPVESSLNPRGQIHLKLPSVLIQVPGGGQVPVCSTHSLISAKVKNYSTTSKIAYVGELVVPRANFWFTFFSVNKIICCKVSHTAYCDTCIWQLQCIFYFSIALFVWLLITLKGKKIKSYLQTEFKRMVK